MESRNKEINPDTLELKPNDTVLLESDTDNAALSETEVAPTETQEAEASDSETKTQAKQNIFIRLFKSELFTPTFKVLCCIFLFSLLVYIVSRFVPAFAEFWTRYPAQAIRFCMSGITSWIPFSLAESLILSLPIIGIAYVIISCISTKADESKKNFYRWLRPMISLVLVIMILFLAMFGPAYGRYSISQNIGIERKNVSAKELYDTGVILSGRTTFDIAKISFDLNGSSIMPYSYSELQAKINDAFEKYAAKEDYISHFNSNPKPIAMSEAMTYTHISGVYTFMTGEANINTNYPDFLLPYTMAHEMAHQRGIAREDEANFVAFLVCIGSDDAYIRYSGYTNMLNYILSALASADASLYAQFVVYSLPQDVQSEFVAYSTFFDKYRESVASEVTGAVNNTFLQSQGQKEGTRSYGLVVDLAVAYYKQ